MLSGGARLPAPLAAQRKHALTLKSAECGYAPRMASKRDISGRRVGAVVSLDASWRFASIPRRGDGPIRMSPDHAEIDPLTPADQPGLRIAMRRLPSALTMRALTSFVRAPRPARRSIQRSADRRRHRCARVRRRALDELLGPPHSRGAARRSRPGRCASRRVCARRSTDEGPDRRDRPRGGATARPAGPARPPQEASASHRRRRRRARRRRRHCGRELFPSLSVSSHRGEWRAPSSSAHPFRHLPIRSS